MGGVGRKAAASPKRMLNKDVLELSVLLALTLVECERGEEAAQVCVVDTFYGRTHSMVEHILSQNTFYRRTHSIVERIL